MSYFRNNMNKILSVFLYISIVISAVSLPMVVYILPSIKYNHVLLGSDYKEIFTVVFAVFLWISLMFFKRPGFTKGVMGLFGPLSLTLASCKFIYMFHATRTLFSDAMFFKFFGFAFHHKYSKSLLYILINLKKKTKKDKKRQKMSTLRNKLKTIYFFACSLILKHPNMFIFVTVMFISFFMNNMSMEAAVLKRDVPFLKKLIADLIDDFNNREQLPRGLPPVYLSESEILNILLVSDNQTEVCANLDYSLKMKVYKQSHSINTPLDWYNSLTPTQQYLFIGFSISSLLFLSIIAYLES